MIVKKYKYIEMFIKLKVEGFVLLKKKIVYEQKYHI